jgi:2-polyprenyl-3-methyl-5-hydroxy-6-metoxy-1,4-benzoquinol methylase
MSIKNFYNDKNNEYFSNIRHEIVEVLKDKKNLKILEVGGGSGKTLVYMKQIRIASSIHLYEIIDVVDDKSYFDSIEIGNVENKDFPKNMFDVIIFADVLEHMIDPTGVIKKAKEALKKGGQIICSIPNIRHFSAIYKIFIKGSFRYAESGLFDKTHLRFFCKSDMEALFNSEPDLTVESIISCNKFIKSKSSLLDKITLFTLTEFLSLQYILVVKNDPI